jgi:hypothetical protein
MISILERYVHLIMLHHVVGAARKESIMFGYVVPMDPYATP